MHPIPMITDAASEKMVRRDMTGLLFGADQLSAYSSIRISLVDLDQDKEGAPNSRSDEGFFASGEIPLSRRRFARPMGKRESNPRHHHVFDLDIFFHAVMRAFAAQATLLDAAEGGDFGGDQAGVDADHSRLQGFGDAPDGAAIAGVDVRSQAERRVVAHR